MASRRINTLSAGEMQKAFIAAALAQQTDCVLLDEPTSFLDYRHQVEICSILKDLNACSGITVIHVTHDINTSLADSRVIALKNGCIAYSGKKESLIIQDLLVQLYETPFETVRHPESGKLFVSPGRACMKRKQQ